MQLFSLFAGVLSVSYTAAALPQSAPFLELLRKRQSTASDSLEVDLGYEIYRGTGNLSTGINSWRGKVNNGQSSLTSSEDCLFLNVQSPANATNLPVLVWIHGGGYATGNGQQDFTELLTVNGKNFVVVSIQYRLGPFGFLASDELVRRGVANAGLLDQQFALEWVQAYISQFGGDPSAVNVSGASAGAGSVMLLDMAYGGYIGRPLFRGIIASSPFLPKQYSYNGWIPTQNYYAFADRAGCSINAYGNSNSTIFDCLVSKDVETLQKASTEVADTATYGTWAFLPVTDGSFVQSTPSKQLLEKRVSGRYAFIGSSANEGTVFVPQDITSQDDFLTWVGNTLPELSESDVAKILRYYPISNIKESSSAIKFATNGVSGPSALDQSPFATGQQQQRANNLYAELTFVCPAYWMAEAYTGAGRKSYKYQFSALPALHGNDFVGYFGPLGKVPYLSSEFQRAFMQMWGNFVTKNNPSIPASVAVGSSNGSTTTNAASQWPVFSVTEPYQINLNQTGGQLITDTSRSVYPIDTPYFSQPGLMNDFSLSDAYTWEAGRGIRCDFWRSMADIIPA